MGPRCPALKMEPRLRIVGEPGNLSSSPHGASMPMANRQWERPDGHGLQRELRMRSSRAALFFSFRAWSSDGGIEHRWRQPTFLRV